MNKKREAGKRQHECRVTLASQRSRILGTQGKRMIRVWCQDFGPNCCYSNFPEWELFNDDDDLEEREREIVLSRWQHKWFVSLSKFLSSTSLKTLSWRSSQPKVVWSIILQGNQSGSRTSSGYLSRTEFLFPQIFSIKFERNVLLKRFLPRVINRQLNSFPR